ncbi:MAG: class II fructose-bisphosphate aldolase [Pseudomonadota bacterium]
MALVKVQDMLAHAYRHKYAVGAFDLFSLDALQGILAASEETRSPVILSLSGASFDLADITLVMPSVVKAARRAGVPVGLHFDFGRDTSAIVRAINLGCNSIMVDGSTLAAPEHAAMLREMVDTAKGCDASVEVLIGTLDEAGSVQHILDLARRSGADSLGVVLGDAGAAGVREGAFDSVAHINQALERPLVIHGGYGLSQDHYRRLIDNGVAKINYHNALHDLAFEQVKQNLAKKHKADFNDLFQGIREIVRDEVVCCQQMWGSAGHAGAVLEHCSVCKEVEHLIIYNVDQSMGPEAAAEMIAEGQRVLGAIPGVRRVFTGEAVRRDAAYQYCWLVRFANESVIASYRDHPDHVDFANTRFRPVAGNRISIDYEEIENPWAF